MPSVKEVVEQAIKDGTLREGSPTPTSYWCGLLQVTNVKVIIAAMGNNVAFTAAVNEPLYEEVKTEDEKSPTKRYLEQPVRVFCPAAVGVIGQNRLPGIPISLMGQFSFKYIPQDPDQKSKIALTQVSLNTPWDQKVASVVPIFGLFRLNEVHHNHALCDDIIYIQDGNIVATKKTPATQSPINPSTEVD